MTDFDEPGRPTGRSEPALNAPWPVPALILLLIGAHAARVAVGAPPDALALTASDLEAGRLVGLITYQLVHGSWAHVLMNSAFTLAFGAPVARFLGRGPQGSTVFFGFFLVCGVVAAVAYGGLETLLAQLGRGSLPSWALVGASGAASGLMGAAARLIQGNGSVGAIGGRTVWAMTASWIIVNVVLGVSGLTPGAGGAPVAWQAHIFGYVAGLILIAPAGWLAGRTSDHDNAL